MTEKRLSIKTFSIDMPVYGDWTLSLIVPNGIVLPNELELVWQEPDVHQCEGLRANNARIEWCGVWTLQCSINHGDWQYSSRCEVLRCPCCKWVAPERGK